MAPCKQGPEGANEEFTLAAGRLCSHVLHSTPPRPVCLKPEDSQPGVDDMETAVGAPPGPRWKL